MNQVRTGVKQVLGFGLEGALCNRADCHGIAAWRIGAAVWASGTEHLADNCVRLQFPLFVCDRCKEKTTIDDIVNAAGWRQIRRHVMSQGKAAPDRSTLKIEFLPVLMGRA